MTSETKWFAECRSLLRGCVGQSSYDRHHHVKRIVCSCVFVHRVITFERLLVEYRVTSGREWSVERGRFAFSIILQFLPNNVSRICLVR